MFIWLNSKAVLFLLFCHFALPMRSFCKSFYTSETSGKLEISYKYVLGQIYVFVIFTRYQRVSTCIYQLLSAIPVIFVVVRIIRIYGQVGWGLEVEAIVAICIQSMLNAKLIFGVRENVKDFGCALYSIVWSSIFKHIFQLIFGNIFFCSSSSLLTFLP